MKNKKQQDQLEQHRNSYKRSVEEKQKQRLEIQKAVAQAWHGHFNNAKVATCEFDARRRNFQGKFSRFKLESINISKGFNDGDAKKFEDWDFKESLWDSYEIVSVSKKLEAGLVLDYNSNDVMKIGENFRVFRKRKESKNSLRNLFNLMSSRRYNEDEVSHQEE